jgi:hypothetical protein
LAEALSEQKNVSRIIFYKEQVEHLDRFDPDGKPVFLKKSVQM